MRGGFGRGMWREERYRAPHEEDVPPGRRRLKLVYRLVPDEHGWPPVDAERLWVAALGDELFQVDNVPFFVQNLSQGDVVRAVPVNGYLFPLGRVRWSGNRTVRVRPFVSGPVPTVAAVFDHFNQLGVEGEGNESYNLAALHVAAEVPPGPVRSLLAHGAAERWWDYEESCVDAAWYRDEPADPHPGPGRGRRG